MSDHSPHQPGPTERDFARARRLEAAAESPHGQIFDDPDVVPELRKAEAEAESPHGATAEKLNAWRHRRWAPHGDMNRVETGDNGQAHRIEGEKQAQRERAAARRDVRAVAEKLDEQPEQPDDPKAEQKADAMRDPKATNRLQEESAAKASSLTSGPGPDVG